MPSNLNLDYYYGTEADQKSLSACTVSCFSTY